MARGKTSLKKQRWKTAVDFPAVLLEKLEQRILLSVDTPLVSSEAIPEALESVPVISSEFALDSASASVVDPWKVIFPDQEFVVWRKDTPWDNLNQVQSPPAGVVELQEISLDIGRNEYESASFVITNLAEEPTSYNISSDASSLSITLRKGVWITLYDGSKIDDALSMIDDNTVVIGSGESMEIWITVNGNDAPAGEYNPTITITPENSAPSTVDLSVTVHNVSLPETLPLNTFYWDYVVPAWDSPEMVDAKLADMKSHYVNTPILHPWALPRLGVNDAGQFITDYTEFDRTIDAYEEGLAPQTYLFTMLSTVYFEPTDVIEFPESVSRPPFLSPEWKELFRDWLTGWVDHMEARGMGYDKYVLYPYDERLDESVYEVVKLIKDIDPQVRIYVNCLGSDAEINNIAPYVDVWGPLLYEYLNDQNVVTGAMTQTVYLRPNTQYTYEFYGQNGNSDCIYWDMNFNGSTPRYAQTLDAADWTKASRTFTTASNTTSVLIRFFPTSSNGFVLIDDVFMGTASGQNLIVNPDMEQGSPPAGWGTYNASITAETTNPHSGSQAAKVRSISPTHPGVNALKELAFSNDEADVNLFPYGDMETGGNATTPPKGWYGYGAGLGEGTVGVSTDTPSGTGQSLRVEGWDFPDYNYSTFGYCFSSSGNYSGDYILSYDYKGDIYTSLFAQSDEFERLHAELDNTDTWTHVEVTLTVDPGTTEFYFYAWDNSPTGRAAYFDNVTLTPAPHEPSPLLWNYDNTNPTTGDGSYKHYRLSAWRTWNAKMTGTGYWVYSYKTHWDYENVSYNWPVVYLSNLADTPPDVSSQELVVPGKKWEATREGLEDYAYLHMLQTLIDSTPLPLDSSILQNAKETLAYWTETVLDFSSIDFASQAKPEILDAIVALTPNMLPGDANGDGVVSAGDYASVQANFGNMGQPNYLIGDANADGVVSAADYASIQANFANTQATTVSPSPINSTTSESVIISTMPVAEATVEQASSTAGRLTTQAKGNKPTKPILEFMNNIGYLSLKQKSFNSAMASSFFESKPYLADPIALHQKKWTLQLSKKHANSGIVSLDSPFTTPTVFDIQSVLLTNNLLDHWNILNL